MKKQMTNFYRCLLVFCVFVFAFNIANANVWTPTGPVQLNSLKGSIVDGDTIALLSPSDLLADSTYTMSAVFSIDGKSITIMPANIANGMPYIVAANNEFQIKNGSLYINNIEFYGGKYFVHITGNCDTIEITNCKIDKIGRGVLTAGGNVILKAVVDNCIITNSGGGDNNVLLGSTSTNGFYKSFQLTNSTLANIQAPIIRITTKSTDSMDIVIDHCTMDSIYAGGVSPFFFGKNYDSIVGNSITISNSVISNVIGCSSLWERGSLDTSSATIVEAVSVWNVGSVTDAVASTEVTLAASYKNLDPMYTDYSDHISTRNLTINNDELLTLSTGGGIIGDPRWRNFIPRTFIPKGPVSFKNLKNIIRDGDIIELLSPSDLLADSTYIMSEVFSIDGKAITIRPANIAKGMPYIAAANNEFQIKNGSLYIDNIEFYGGKYFVHITGNCDEIEITNCKIDKIGRGVLTAGGNVIQKAFVDNCVITNSGGGDNNVLLGSTSTNGFYKSFQLTNSTLANIQAPIIRITTKSTDSMDIVIDHCTMDSIYAGGVSPFYFGKNYDSIVGNSITISNSLISNVTGCSSLWERGSLDTPTATIVEAVNVWNVGVVSDSVVSTAVTLAASYKNMDPQYSYYSSDISRRNFGVNNPELLTLATDGGVIGDPRWVKPDGLVAQWKLNETSGTILKEELNGADAEIIGAGAAFTTGTDGGAALDLTNAVDSAMVVVEDSESTSAINFTDGSLSVSLLVKFDPAAVGEQQQQEIFMKGSNNHIDGGAGANGTRYEMYAKNGGIYFVIDDDASKSQLTMDQTNFKANSWAHLVGVRDTEKDSMYFYCNGLPAGQMLDGSGAIDVDTIPLIIGNYWNKENKLHGELDDFQIYNKALSAEDIAALFATYDTERKIDGLVGYWNFDEGSGTNVADQLGMSDGDLYNGGDANWVDGFMGKALDFSKSVSTDTTVFVEIPSTEAVDYDSTESFTYSVLVKSDISVDAPEQSILCKGNPWWDNGGWYHMEYKEGKVRFMTWDSTTLSSPVGEVPASYPQNDWVHLVFVKNAGTDSLYIYANGDLLDSGADETINDIATDGNVFIGVVPRFETQWLGLIDELKVYNRALSAKEISLISYDYGMPKIILNGNSTLSDLQVGGTTVDAFDAATVLYDVELAAGTTTPPAVTATIADDLASFSVAPAASIPGATTVTVTAEDGTQTVYTVNFTLPESSNANLSGISTTPAVTLSPAFSPATTAYTAELVLGTTSVNVTATKEDATASVTGGGDVDVSSGSGTATLVVTAEDGTEKTYKVDFTVSTVGINNFADMGISMYPNPAENNLIVKNLSEVNSAYIYDSNGRIIKTLNNINANNVNIDISDLNSGTYVIRLVTVNELIINSTFIKK